MKDWKDTFQEVVSEPAVLLDKIVEKIKKFLKEVSI